MPRLDRPLQLFVVLAASACTAPVRQPPCGEPLFGRPVAATGLSSAQCQPGCSCGAAFTPRDWSPEQLGRLTAWTLENAFAEVSADPYAAGPDAGAPGQVCAVVVTDPTARRYRLRTFSSSAEASDAGALLTHHDACGVCSTLADLAVYARDPDLGAPVRQCGIDTFSAGHDADVQCLQGLGFTLPCAQIWAWNTAHTRSSCLDPCLRLSADAGYNLPDGGLNACLQCDEDRSGAVFKAVAGRTRRNTGIATAICRPCAETRAVPHAYVELP